jgi:hypothetical protein
MDANSSVIIPVPFLSKTNSVARHAIHPEVQDCQVWLVKNGFTGAGMSGHGYSPGVGCRFEVLQPLESCGNGKHLPALDVGVWTCVSHDRGMSSLRSRFRSLDGKVVEFRVGYEPIGIHAIMAWKNNIRLV